MKKIIILLIFIVLPITIYFNYSKKASPKLESSSEEIHDSSNEKKPNIFESSDEEASAIGIIGEPANEKEAKILKMSDDEASALGEIDGKSSTEESSKITKASFTVEKWDEDNLVLNYTTNSAIASMLNSKSTISLYDNASNKLLSSSLVEASSKSTTDSLSNSIKLYVGDFKEINLVIEESNVKTDNGVYSLTPTKNLIISK